jgi:predicted phage terminase large subunit-like protein
MSNPEFGAVFFRRTSPQIRNEGGLWDESVKLYPLLGAQPKESTLQWIFPSGSKIKFTHLEHEKNILDHMGSQYPLICYDELTHFSRKQFFYLLSRNRSTCGVKPYIRGTCNPDPDSWVCDFIDWWIDKDGYAIPERSGVIKWFIVENDEVIWSDSKLSEFHKSFTFINANIHDNIDLMEKDPGYLANLNALDRVQKARLLYGNWKIRASAGMIFNRNDFEIVDAAPVMTKRVRSWDLAATQDGGDWTAGIELGRGVDGFIYVIDVRRAQLSAKKVDDLIKNTASQDGKDVTIRIPQDPGQAGKSQKAQFVSLLIGYIIKFMRPTGSKLDRARPWSSQTEAGNVKLVRGSWNTPFLNEMDNFTGKDGETDDQADAFNDGMDELVNGQKEFFMMSG